MYGGGEGNGGSVITGQSVVGASKYIQRRSVHYSTGCVNCDGSSSSICGRTVCS